MMRGLRYNKSEQCLLREIVLKNRKNSERNIYLSYLWGNQTEEAFEGCLSQKTFQTAVDI